MGELESIWIVNEEGKLPLFAYGMVTNRKLGKMPMIFIWLIYPLNMSTYFYVFHFQLQLNSNSLNVSTIIPNLCF